MPEQPCPELDVIVEARPLTATVLGGYTCSYTETARSMEAAPACHSECSAVGLGADKTAHGHTKSSSIGNSQIDSYSQQL